MSSAGIIGTMGKEPHATQASSGDCCTGCIGQYLRRDVSTQSKLISGLFDYYPDSTILSESGVLKGNVCDSMGISPVRICLGPKLFKINDNGFIGEHYLDGEQKLGSVEILGDNCFADCGTISIFDDLVSIGEGCFDNSEITECDLSENLVFLGKYAFRECNSLVDINIPAKLTDYAPFNNTFLSGFGCPRAGGETGDIFDGKPYTINDLVSFDPVSGQTDLTTISGKLEGGAWQTDTFRECRSLTSASFADGVNYIPKRSFYKCKKLNSISIPASVASIEERAFYDCRNMQSLSFAGAPQSIGNGAFQNCRQLQSVSFGLPNSGEEDCCIRIRNSAFYNTQLTGVVEFPRETCVIGRSSFSIDYI